MICFFQKGIFASILFLSVCTTSISITYAEDSSTGASTGVSSAQIKAFDAHGTTGASGTTASSKNDTESTTVTVTEDIPGAGCIVKE